jgi:transcriptional regulator with XRE-family HTH domain
MESSKCVEFHTYNLTDFENVKLMRKQNAKKNILGPIIRELRESQGLSQSAFAVKLNLLGWDVSRDIIARIEGQVRWVADFEIEKLAMGLKITPTELLQRAISRKNRSV